MAGGGSLILGKYKCKGFSLSSPVLAPNSEKVTFILTARWDFQTEGSDDKNWTNCLFCFQQLPFYYLDGQTHIRQLDKIFGLTVKIYSFFYSLGQKEIVDRARYYTYRNTQRKFGNCPTQNFYFAIFQSFLDKAIKHKVTDGIIDATEIYRNDNEIRKGNELEMSLTPPSLPQCASAEGK
ncbi:hypothetical protein llap_4462 [Limosa lapponica baueri]|uniref:Uncharacterized protein n=1 Tax=Limosa lapponica baueri TaxID=1758121 RepID=A0A2I0UGQ7_LIMLA|nr:hypothetical protein llap_4462 [Limosa lapponica baueri]